MTEPSKKALDYAARKAGYEDWHRVSGYGTQYTAASVVAHAKTLDELWAIKPPKTRGELFAEEMMRRRNGFALWADVAREMIDEGWEPKDD